MLSKILKGLSFLPSDRETGPAVRAPPSGPFPHSARFDEQTEPQARKVSANDRKQCRNCIMHVKEAVSFEVSRLILQGSRHTLMCLARNYEEETHGLSTAHKAASGAFGG